MSEILAFAEASASDPKLSAEPVPDTEAGDTTITPEDPTAASSEKEMNAQKAAPDSDTGSAHSDSRSGSSEQNAPASSESTFYQEKISESTDSSTQNQQVSDDTVSSGSDEFDSKDFTSENSASSDDSEKDPFTGEKKSSHRRVFHTAKELNYLREKYILEKIPDDQLLEYLKLDEKRHELQVQERNIREKRIMNAFMLTVILAAIVAVVYSLHENPTVLISILYIGGILAGVHVWNKKK